MNHEMTHERCSELLREWASEELDDATRALVDDHLAHCAQCASERDGLAALLALETGDALSEIERARLHRALEREATFAPGDTRPRRRGGRVAGALGAVAVVTLVAVGAGYVLTQGAGESAQDASSAGGGAASTPSQAGPRPGVASQFGAGKAEGGPTRANRSPLLSQAIADLPPGARPRFLPGLGKLDAAGLWALGRAAPMPAFATSYSASTAARHKTAFLSALATQAPDPATARSVRSCGLAAQATLQTPALAAFATTARFDEAQVVVVGFAVAPSGSGRLDHFAVFAYRSCSARPVDVVRGAIAG